MASGTEELRRKSNHKNPEKVRLARRAHPDTEQRKPVGGGIDVFRVISCYFDSSDLLVSGTAQPTAVTTILPTAFPEPFVEPFPGRAPILRKELWMSRRESGDRLASDMMYLVDLRAFVKDEARSFKFDQIKLVIVPDPVHQSASL